MLKDPPTLARILIGCVLALSGCETGPLQSEAGHARFRDFCDENQYKPHELYAADFTGNGRPDILVWGEQFKDGCILLPESNWHISLNDYSERLVGEFFHGETRTKGMADILTVDPRTGNNRLFVSRSRGGALSFHGRSINPKVFSMIGDSRVSLFQGELNYDGREINEVIAWWKLSGELKIVSFQLPNEQESTSCLIDESLINRGLDLTVRDFNGDGRDDLRFWVRDVEGNIVVRTFNTYLTPEQHYRFMDEQGKYYHPHECPIRP